VTIRNWKIFKLLLRVRDKFRQRQEIVELEARVYRCETIMETVRAFDDKEPELKLQEKDASHDCEEKIPSLPDVEEETQRTDNEVSVAILKSFRTPNNELLLKEIERDFVLGKYLEEANNDPILALAYAKGHVAFQTRIRSSEVATFSERSFLGKASLPLVLIIVTALAGNLVGTILQKQAFERNKQFEVKLERLREAEKTTSNLIVSLGEITPKIERDEETKTLNWNPKGTLQRYRHDLEKVRNMAQGLDGNHDIEEKLESANDELNRYIECLGENAADESTIGTKNLTCSRNFKLGPFRELQDSISLALIGFLSS
jgi:hypothetical protein